ncbi:bll3000 [Bradyrhizobium diazoefficiens USDA 110]|uniref:Bll3000 protein n=1 Tax=Bradyrhizobium diazoefficiens (strain JCM 10833 / BCRC 13528 / IAM 13628 / NBRC 14792 / USDA 110) TaxID=224911 RepID=Q89QX2_BRADU|nr:hypothetical protein CO678_02890 [Bradyrhizobium diazoefficiens]BAC48265.1 bll3000 [Bradyrhizobium diazoefficiens USDA 110]
MPAMPPRPPYRGIRPQNQSCLSKAALRIRPEKGGPGAALVGQWPSLLVVVLQNLVAGLRDLGPVLLQAGQDGEIALIDDRTAELLHIARAGLLLGVRATPLLGKCRRGKGRRQQGESDEKLTHCIPSF